MNKEFYILRYERTEYAKRIRKDYESKRIKERRCNMRKWGIRHDGLCNTLSTVQKDNYLLEVTYKDDRDMNKDIAPVIVGGIGEINFGKQYRQGNRIYDANSIAMALLSSPVGNAGGYSYLYAIGGADMNNEPFIVASRGRNPENPSDRTTGSPTEQRLEPNTKGLCNTLTTVQKDNLVAEPVNPMPDGTCRTIKNQYYKTSQANYERTGSMGATGVNTGLRIRKLTPKECWRLMGFDDEDFYKAEAVNSNTQLYKQAGNSIVVNVLEALFINLRPYMKG